MLLDKNRIVIFAKNGGCFMNLIENNSQKIFALCKKHKVGKLFVFGSILTDRFNEDSDVDMVVDFDAVISNCYSSANQRFNEICFSFLSTDCPRRF